MGVYNVYIGIFFGVDKLFWLILVFSVCIIYLSKHFYAKLRHQLKLFIFMHLFTMLSLFDIRLRQTSLNFGYRRTAFCTNVDQYVRVTSEIFILRLFKIVFYTRLKSSLFRNHVMIMK